MSDILKLLDNGWRVCIYKNQLSSYTARAVKIGDATTRVYEDAFDPDVAIKRLIDKITTRLPPTERGK